LPLCLILKANAIQLDCDYKTDHSFFDIHEHGSIACDARNLRVTTPNEKITQASTNFQNGNDKVRALRILKQTFNFIPSSIDKLFPNLRGILIEDSDVFRVFQSNFKAFPELRGLWLRRNKWLEVLERDLFKFNKKLIYINLCFNNLKHIDANILDDINCLSTIEFVWNPCVDMNVANEPMTALKVKFQQNCQNGNVLGSHEDFKKKNRIINT